MQQLDNITLSEALALHDTSVQVIVPLPQTPLKAEQLARAFTSQFGFVAGSADWGADRYQVMLSKLDDDEPLRCILYIEWLCEAIWLEPTGTTNLQTLWQALTTR